MKPHPLVHTFRTLDEKPDLAKAQELVGGNVEIIEIPMHHPEAKYDYIQILVNEEALLLPDMEYNPVATELVLSKTKKHWSTQEVFWVRPSFCLERRVGSSLNGNAFLFLLS